MPTHEEKAAGRVLLPDDVVPSRYDLRFVPDLERFTFQGKASIAVQVVVATDEVTLHANELRVSSAAFKPAAGDAAPEVESISYHLRRKTVMFKFGDFLPVGEGVLEVCFTGVLNDQMAGFYRSRYTDIYGNTKVMATTQFEATDARRAFPCWDEPGRKAVFGVTLVVDPSLVALSNMPEKSSRLVTEGSKVVKEVEFMDSPKMSTYLLAMVVGELDFVQSTTTSGVLVRTYASPGRGGEGMFSTEFATKCVELYNDFFGIKYPLPKLDLVGINEFSMGAMENWGLVTCREAYLLVDSATASSEQKQRVARMVAHELAHQWFGNLVTMAWWDDLWLNEGFATWCEFYSTDKIFPEFHVWEQFQSDRLAAALKLDSLKTSHPIQVPIKTAEEAFEVFDAISYSKGASVIRMATAILGLDVFRKALQIYMERHQYNNTETLDLWTAWQEVAGDKVKVHEVMASWTEQLGFPMLRVTAFSIAGATAKVSLEQQWFLASGEEPPEERTWAVPLFIRTLGSDSKRTVMMTTKTMDVELPLSSDTDSEFVLLNDSCLAPVRVCYTAPMRERLVKAIRAGHLAPVDRGQIILDAYALTKAGKLGMDELLRLLAAYRGEKDYIVWRSLQLVMKGLQHLLMGAPSRVYQHYMEVAEILIASSSDVLAQLGWVPGPSDGHVGAMLRGLLMDMVATFAPTGAFLDEAKRRFALYVEDPIGQAKELPGEYRTQVLSAVLSASDGAQELQQVLATFKKLTSNEDQRHIYLSAGFVKSRALKQDVLRWATSGEVKPQDIMRALHSVSTSSKEGLELTWQHYKDDFPNICRMVEDALGIMGHVIQACAAGFCSQEKAADIEEFFDKHPLPSQKRKISQVLEEIRTNAAFLDRALTTDISKDDFWADLKTAMRATAP